MTSGKVVSIAWRLLGTGDPLALEEMIDDGLKAARTESAKAMQWEIARQLDIFAETLMEEARNFDPNMAKTNKAHALMDAAKLIRAIDPGTTLLYPVEHDGGEVTP